MNNKEIIFGMTGVQLLAIGACAIIGITSTIEYANKFVERRREKEVAAYEKVQAEIREVEETKAKIKAAEEARRHAEEAAIKHAKRAEEALMRAKAADEAARNKAGAKTLARRNALLGKFKREGVELAAEITMLDEKRKEVAADLDAYNAILASHVVPSRVLVTNVYRYCMSAAATNVVEKLLTSHERVVKIALMAFNDKGLESIYKRYVPGETFARIKSDLMTDFRSLTESHEEFGRQRDQRRKAATGRINALNSASDSETRKLKAELEADRQTIADYKYTSTDSPLYVIRRRKAKELEKKYKVDSIWSAENIVISRLKALDDQKALSHKFKVADVVRHEANADVDAESEERFKQDKTACVQRYYDKISRDFIIMLESKKATIADQMEAAQKRAEAVTAVLDNWELLDEERVDEMARDMQKKILDAVAEVR